MNIVEGTIEIDGESVSNGFELNIAALKIRREGDWLTFRDHAGIKIKINPMILEPLWAAARVINWDEDDRRS